MISCRASITFRFLFITALTLGLSGLLITHQLVLRKLYAYRRPLDDGYPALSENDQIAARKAESLKHSNTSHSLLNRNASRSENNTNPEKNSTSSHGLWSPSHNLGAHRNSTAPRTARFPTADSSVLDMTVGVIGMLGNRMFQYASLLGIAHMNYRRPFCGTSSDLHKVFEVTHIHDRSSWGFVFVGERDFATYDPTFEHLPNSSVIVGLYLQSWKYFDAIRDTIRQEFRFKQHLKDQAAHLLQKFASRIGQKVKVGVHVRRGDMTSYNSQQRGYHTAPASYLMKAMDYMRQKHGDIIFVVVTEDVYWCMNALNSRSDYVIADRAPGDVHMALLASCDHVIMTVGTYGWWGGYLSGGDVVYYWDLKESLHNPPMEVEIRHPEDFFPPSWVPLTG